MTVNFKVVTRIIGILLLVLGFSLIPSLVVALIYREVESIPAFVFFSASFIISLSLQILYEECYPFV